MECALSFTLDWEICMARVCRNFAESGSTPWIEAAHYTDIVLKTLCLLVVTRRNQQWLTYLNPEPPVAIIVPGI